MNSPTDSPPKSPDDAYDFDVAVVGSGFGGSVAALRLAQKGYRVVVLEAGKRWRAEDFPKTNWAVNRFLWAPALRCFGIQRIDLLRDVLVLSGAGVGGGSLVYANTLYVPKAPFFAHPTVSALGGESALLPFYDVARRMLGVTENPKLYAADELMQATADELGFGETFQRTPVGVNFAGGPGEDPYFGGEGPERNPCVECGGCMVGCRYRAKNTLDRNYLYFAEKAGAEIRAETRVTDLRPLDESGASGYAVHTRRTTAWLGGRQRPLRVRKVVLSAGVLGTLRLLTALKETGRLPRVSDALGRTVRTNSESLIAVTADHDRVDHSEGIAITSSVHPDADTHIEPVRYPRGADAMGLLAAPTLVDGGAGAPRQLRFVASMLRHPLRTLRFSLPFRFAKRTIILLVMQTIDNSLRVTRRRRWWWPFGKGLTSRPEGAAAPPTYIPAAHTFARALARRMSGQARSSVNEVLLDVPATAHILGGACIGATPGDGVVDLDQKVHGYANLWVCDGSVVPANLGVNPSLTITALTERAMSRVPAKGQPRRFGFERSWGVEGLLDGAADAAESARAG